jgi:nucleoside-diphosphate kinase
VGLLDPSPPPFAAGATNPLQADAGSIRGQYAVDIGRNIIHGSDSVDSAKREIGLWFPEGLADYRPHMGPWVYEKF